MRILLFLATNFAILLVAGTVLSRLGFDSIMAANGVDLNLSALLVFCGVFGFGGSLISLFLSRWLARRGTGTVIIEQARSQDEQWLLQTVKELADDAGIGMPQVGVFPSQASNAFAAGWNRNDAMVGALQRLRSEQALQQELPGELTAFGISEQMKEGVSRLFSSHPPLEERIRALQNAA